MRSEIDLEGFHDGVSGIDENGVREFHPEISGFRRWKAVGFR
jgi:hypothetical protein